MRKLLSYLKLEDSTTKVISASARNEKTKEWEPTTDESNRYNRYVRYNFLCKLCNQLYTESRRNLPLEACKVCKQPIERLTPVIREKRTDGNYLVVTAERVHRYTTLDRVPRNTLAVFTSDGLHRIPHEEWWSPRLKFALPPDYLEDVTDHTPEPDGKGAVRVTPVAVIASAAAKAQVF